MQKNPRTTLGMIALASLVSLPLLGANADAVETTQLEHEEGLPPILREGEAEFVPRPGDADKLFYEPVQSPESEQAHKEAPLDEEPLNGGISISDTNSDGDLLAKSDQSQGGADSSTLPPPAPDRGGESLVRSA